MMCAVELMVCLPATDAALVFRSSASWSSISWSMSLPARYSSRAARYSLRTASLIAVPVLSATLLCIVASTTTFATIAMHMMSATTTNITVTAAKRFLSFPLSSGSGVW